MRFMLTMRISKMLGDNHDDNDDANDDDHVHAGLSYVTTTLSPVIWSLLGPLNPQPLNHPKP